MKLKPEYRGTHIGQCAECKHFQVVGMPADSGCLLYKRHIKCTDEETSAPYGYCQLNTPACVDYEPETYEEEEY